MIRKIIKIDEEKCNGCGACAAACHEGAIGMVNGKAKLLRDDYCDGLGDCLPACPTNAISFEMREADAYDESAVKAHMAAKKDKEASSSPCGCPGAQSRMIQREETEPTDQTDCKTAVSSRLSQWPVQIKLAPVNAPYFDHGHLLIAADCTAYAYGNFHNDFISGRVTLIGCPKLDMTDYTEKLTEIITQNHIESITVTRMIVPCCGGIESAVKNAVKNSGKVIPLKVVTIDTNGRILDR